MVQRRLTLLAAGLATLPAWYTRAGEVVIPAPPAPDLIARAPSYEPDQPVVATHYFYWYQWPDDHFFDDPARTHDILRQHFPEHRAVSYASEAWHRRQLQDLTAAGIDVALLVYWGAPNQYDTPDIRFSVRGIPPMVAALDELAKEGPTPRIGLFYDTSTLLAQHAFREPRSDNVDLRTEEGKDLFYRTIRDFFCLVPPWHWACLDGRPLVQLYGASFAAGHDQSTLDYVYTRFAADFAGRRPFIVTGPSWSFAGDARTGWGAALNGPILSPGAAQIGPGYDDSPVPGRQSPTRDRLGGGFYAASWLLALQSNPRLVIIETWSELHEGTAICETLEDGRFYIDLTRRYSNLFKARRDPAPAAWADALRAVLEAPMSSRQGRAFASRPELTLRLAKDGHLEEQGVRLCPGVADGVYELTEQESVPCIATRPGVGRDRYLYFDIADPYYYDHRGTIRLSFTYLDSGRAPIVIHYDSAENTGTLADRYKAYPRPILRNDSNTWQTADLTLTQARCANGENGGADFRLVSPGAELAIASVAVSKLPPDYNR